MKCFIEGHQGSMRIIRPLQRGEFLSQTVRLVAGTPPQRLCVLTSALGLNHRTVAPAGIQGYDVESR
jgi:hypothetical protein